MKLYWLSLGLVTRISLLGGFEGATFIACGQYIETLP